MFTLSLLDSIYYTHNVYRIEGTYIIDYAESGLLYSTFFYVKKTKAK